MVATRWGLSANPEPWIELWDLLSENINIKSLIGPFRCANQKNTQTNGWTRFSPPVPNQPSQSVTFRYTGGETSWGTESSNEGICQTSSWQLQTMCLCLQGSACFGFSASRRRGYRGKTTALGGVFGKVCFRLFPKERIFLGRPSESLGFWWENTLRDCNQLR